MNNLGPRDGYNQIRNQCPGLFTSPSDASYKILFDEKLMADAESAEKRRLSDRGLPIS
jgi:hypothetical protein